MPPDLDFPRLRPGLAAAPDDDPRFVYLYDPRRLAGPPQRVKRDDLAWLQLCNGRRSLREIQAEAIRLAGGTILPLDLFSSVLEKLDGAHYLESERFRAHLTALVRAADREPVCIGCYSDNPADLRRQLDRLFTAPGGPGRPGTPRSHDGPTLRAALVPHIDYARGNVTFGWGFKEVFERTDASLFVIVGTSHYSAHRFTLTRQNFKTPLGTVPTDQAYVDRLVRHYGNGLFDDPLAHLPEHSIELEVVLLRYLYENVRPIRIVPLLVGSFGDCIDDATEPARRRDVAKMVEALRLAEAETPERVCYVISGDLAHVGPKFGDPEPVGEPFVTHSRAQDRAILDQAERADPQGYFRAVAAEDDRRRICGLPPTYTVLEALKPSHGRVLHYGCYVHPTGFESVSFASVGFYGAV